MSLFPFTQFELPGGLGIDAGRYLIRAQEGDGQDVLVLAALQAPRRGRRRRPRRARGATQKPDAQPLPAVRATVVRAEEFAAEDDARQWLAQVRTDPDTRDHFAAEARALLNRAIHAHRAATMDPYVAELGPDFATATRIGYGNGDELAAGMWTEAIEAPPDPERRQRRREALRSQERLAALLGGRDEVAPYETLILRAHLDLDQGRLREAALQLEAAVRGLLGGLGEGSGDEQQSDLAALRKRLPRLERTHAEALSQTPFEDAEGLLDETVAICERALRRHRILDPETGKR